MASHLTHVGVHDHGFNNVSTYGNLLRLMREGRLPAEPWESRFYEVALKVSGAVQAARWTRLGPDLGYVPSFNGRTPCSRTPSARCARSPSRTSSGTC
jgi:hypothetical protein